MPTQDELREYRLNLLLDARGLAMECNYGSALDLIEELLTESPNDLEGLRLKGNVLEQKVLDLNEYSGKKLNRSSEYLAAQRCYEQILQLDPTNTVALIDLGDHFRNLEAFDKAFSYYERAVTLLKTGEARLGRTEEIQELLRTFVELGREQRNVERTNRLKMECEELLNQKSP